MTTCEIDGCDNEATHLDLFDNKMCQECVGKEINMGSMPSMFDPIGEYEQAVAEAAMSLQKQALTIFEENLSAKGLVELQEESKLWPAKATTSSEYKIVADQHKRMKRLHVAVRRKADEFVNIEKEKYNVEKTKIKTDLSTVLSVLDPLVKRLGTARSDWDDKIKADKQAKVDAEAKKQRLEFERIQKVKDTAQAWIDNEEFDERKKELESLKAELENKKIIEEKLTAALVEKTKISAELKVEHEALTQDLYVVECLNSRLEFKEAYEDAMSDGWFESEEAVRKKADRNYVEYDEPQTDLEPTETQDEIHQIRKAVHSILGATAESLINLTELDLNSMRVENAIEKLIKSIETAGEEFATACDRWETA